MGLQLQKFYQINFKAWCYSLYGKESYKYYKKSLQKELQDELNEQATYVLHGKLIEEENKKDFTMKDEKKWGSQLNEWIEDGVSKTRIRTLLLETLEKENFSALDEVFKKYPEKLYPFYQIMWEKAKNKNTKITDSGKIYMCEKMRIEKPGRISYKELLQKILDKHDSEEMIVYCISTAIHTNKEINGIEQFLTAIQVFPDPKSKFAQKYFLNQMLEKTLPVNEQPDDASPVMKI
jgi:hypothetical protein